ncbi:putative multi-sensor signal transduction histidine kinase [Actinoplanes friuliensis DSM 7358]|uniref:histidine kinase n=1 Tax=Actinoplanes friuliensis DSM 7358 TaxID=1246995 RepID=U5VV88_9ACTN|nr:putative multi-sensor signal transduction histidine kinase [Actinoplanes friuliensis DSM 7358]
MQALRATGLLDADSATSLDRLTRLATRLVKMPVALVSLVDVDRQVFVSAVGLEEPWASRGQTPLSHSFCQYVVTDQAPLVITDARADGRLCGNLAIRDLNVIAYAGFPLHSPDGQVLGSFCAIDGRPRQWTEDEVEILQDLAANAESEIALYTAHGELMLSSARMQTVLDTTQDAFVSMDHAGLVTAWNDAAHRLFGWSAAEAMGRPATELMIPERFHDAHRAGLERVRQGGRSRLSGQRVELIATDRDNREFPVEMTMQMAMERDRPVFHAFLHDITERRRLADQREQLLEQEQLQVRQLRELDKMKDDLVAVVSHELRNPIGVIRGYTELMAADPDLPEVLRQDLTVIDHTSARLTHLVDDLLDLAQLDAGKQFHLVPLDPGPLIQDAVRTHRITASARQVTLISEVEPLPVIPGEPRRLQQVLDNLLSNAVKYSLPGGTVTVTARHHDDRFVLTIADTGIGIPAEQYPHLFDRFFRASTATGLGIKGTGLGLAVTKAIVEAHDGTISAEPGTDGGTRFIVSLPARVQLTAEL